MKYSNFTRHIANYTKENKNNPKSIIDDYELLKKDIEKIKSIVGFDKKTSWTSDFFSYYYLRNLYDYDKLRQKNKIIYLYESIDIILNCCNERFKLTNERLARLANNLDKLFKDFDQNINIANRTILFSSNDSGNIRVIDKMKRDFPEINNLIELLVK